MFKIYLARATLRAVVFTAALGFVKFYGSTVVVFVQ